MPQHTVRGTLGWTMWASHGMISDFRTRQPRDGPMQCGTQPADISVIHRRLKLLGVALSIRCGKTYRHRRLNHAQDCEDDAYHT